MIVDNGSMEEKGGPKKRRKILLNGDRRFGDCPKSHDHIVLEDPHTTELVKRLELGIKEDEHILNDKLCALSGHFDILIFING